MAGSLEDTLTRDHPLTSSINDIDQSNIRSSSCLFLASCVVIQNGVDGTWAGAQVPGGHRYREAEDL